MGVIGTFFSSVTNKVFAAIIVALAIACGLFFWQWHSYQDKYDTAKTTIGIQARTIKERDDTIDKLTKSQKITDTVRTEIKTDQDKVAEQTKTIQHDTVVKVVEIEKKYNNLPPTPENKVQEDKEISLVYVDSMWKTYCSSGIKDPGCSNVDPTPPATSPTSMPTSVRAVTINDIVEDDVLISTEESLVEETVT